MGRAGVQLGGGKRGGDVGHDWCGVWRLSCGSVYTLSPLRISIPISLTPTPGMGSPRRGIRVHGSRLASIIRAMNKWWTTNVGKAPSTDWRLYYLPVEVFMNTVTAGEGERLAFEIKSAAGLGCLFIIRDVVVFVDRVCGLCGGDERWGSSKASSLSATRKAKAWKRRWAC